MKEFSWALITGASSGIGEALSRLLADKKINVILHGRDINRLRALAAELSSKVEVIIVRSDLATIEGRNEVVRVIHKQAPTLVVNNAGYGLYGDALTYETAVQMQLLNVDVAALLEISLEAARTMVSKGESGVIANISSAAAFPVFPGLAVYSACKAFVNQFSLSLDEEVRPYGVRILVSCPGMVDTQFRERAGGVEKMKKSPTMTPEFAATEIWNQIESQMKIRIFDWKTHLAIGIQALLPRKWVASFLRKNIASRHPPREIIKITQTKS